MCCQHCKAQVVDPAINIVPRTVLAQEQAVVCGKEVNCNSELQVSRARGTQQQAMTTHTFGYPHTQPVLLGYPLEGPKCTQLVSTLTLWAHASQQAAGTC